MPFNDVIGQESPKKKIRTALANGTIGHAYLFTGEEGIGKRLMALRFAQALSCECPPQSGQVDSCGQCQACLQIEGLSYPDLLLIEPEQEKAKPQIKVDHVREVERHMIYKPLLSLRKICIIDDADCLNTNAANAFLKTLEDPPDHSLFILITSRSMLLPATVRSRCLTLKFSLAKTTQVEGTLALKQSVPAEDARFLSQLCGNRIGVALTTDVEAARGIQEHFLELCGGEQFSTITDALNKAEEFSKTDRFTECIEWLTYGLRDILLVRIGAPQELLLHQSHYSTLKKISDRLEPEQVLDLLDLLSSLEQAPQRNLNLQLGLEHFLVRFHQVLHQHAA